MATPAMIAGSQSAAAAAGVAAYWRVGWRVRRADDEFLRRQPIGAVARQILSLGANAPNPAN